MPARVQLDLPGVFDPGYRGQVCRAAGNGWLSWIFAAAARWQQRRMLETLDDRMLHDIGISRSQALAEAAKPCWRL